MELTIEKALHQGVVAHKEGRLKDAELFYRAILKAKPMHPDANHNLGVLAVSLNKASVALPFFKNAVESNPDSQQFWFSYIDALIKEEQYDNAKNFFEQAEKKDFDKEKLGIIKSKLSSIDDSENVKDLNPSQQDLIDLSNHFQNGRFNEAEELALCISKEFPLHQFSWKVLGILFKKTGRINKALEASEKSVQCNFDDFEAHNNLGNILLELDRLTEAEKSLKRAISLKADVAETHNNLGTILFKLDRLNEAEVSFKKAVVLNPDFLEVHNNLGKTLSELGKLEEAEFYLVKKQQG